MTASRCLLRDLSFLPRVGFKGPDAPEFLRANDVPVPARANEWIAHRGGIVGRLGASEYFLESSADDPWTRALTPTVPGPAQASGAAPAARIALTAPQSVAARAVAIAAAGGSAGAAQAAVKAANAAQGAGVPTVVHIPREDTALELAGEQVHALLAQTCSYPFEALSDSPDTIVMTQMIGISVLALRVPSSLTPTYRVWCDPTYGDYLIGTLQDVAKLRQASTWL